jgi:hypothetical protein
MMRLADAGEASVEEKTARGGGVRCPGSRAAAAWKTTSTRTPIS